MTSYVGNTLKTTGSSLPPLFNNKFQQNKNTASGNTLKVIKNLKENNNTSRSKSKEKGLERNNSRLITNNSNDKQISSRNNNNTNKDLVRKGTLLPNTKNNNDNPENRNTSNGSNNTRTKKVKLSYNNKGASGNSNSNDPDKANYKNNVTLFDKNLQKSGLQSKLSSRLNSPKKQHLTTIHSQNYNNKKQKSITYKPHTFKSYQELQKIVPIKVGGLGSNIGTPEWLAMFEKNKKIKRFNDITKIKNENLPSKRKDMEDYKIEAEFKQQKERSAYFKTHKYGSDLANKNLQKVLDHHNNALYRSVNLNKNKSDRYSEINNRNSINIISKNDKNNEYYYKAMTEGNISLRTSKQNSNYSNANESGYLSKNKSRKGFEKENKDNLLYSALYDNDNHYNINNSKYRKKDFIINDKESTIEEAYNYVINNV